MATIKSLRALKGRKVVVGVGNMAYGSNGTMILKAVVDGNVVLSRRLVDDLVFPAKVITSVVAFS